MKFYIIGVSKDDTDAAHMQRLETAVSAVRGRDGHVEVPIAWVQDERDLAPPSEAQYQRRTYL